MRILLAALAFLLLAAGSSYYLLHGLIPAARTVHAAEPVEVPPSLTDVYVPAAGLAAGTILTLGNLSKLPLDPEAVTDEMVVADETGRSVLVGSVARHALSRGVPIARSSVVQPGERGFLAAVLPQGKRAISIPIGETAGLSGLVMPGDRVDIIVTYSVEGAVIDAVRDVRASETVLSNLRVLALDQRLQEVADPNVDAGARPIARSATLEVTPRQAEMLTLATQLGELSMVLNSIKDGGTEAEVLAEREERATAGDRRELTLDSQVTSLLYRQLQSDAAEEQSDLAERVSRVQIVRGIQSQAMQIDGEASTAGFEAGNLARAVNALAAAAPPN